MTVPSRSSGAHSRRRIQVFGPDHPDVALSLNNLGSLLEDRGKHGEAEKLSREALAIDERAARITRSLSETATILPVRYERKGKLNEATQAEARAVSFIHEVLRPGPNSSRLPICWNRE
jgi:hypothetical protein